MFLYYNKGMDISLRNQSKGIVLILLACIWTAPVSMVIIRKECTKQAYFYRALNNMILNRPPLQTLDSKRLTDCLDACLHHEKCQSTNANINKETGFVKCHLLKEDRTTMKNKDFIKKEGWSYYDSGYETSKVGTHCMNDVKNSCYPCKCRDDCTKDGYSCDCTGHRAYFRIRHSSGKYVCYNEQEQLFVFASNCQGTFEFTGKGMLRHRESARYVVPKTLSSESMLVLGGKTESENSKFTFLQQKQISHVKTGFCLHPKGGTTNPAENTKITINKDCSNSLKLANTRIYLPAQYHHNATLVYMPMEESSNLEIYYGRGTDSAGRKSFNFVPPVTLIYNDRRKSRVLAFKTLEKRIIAGKFSGTCLNNPDIGPTSITFWMELKNQNHDIVIFRTTYGRDTGFLFAYVASDRKLVAFVRYVNLQFQVAYIPSIPLTDWHHFAIVQTKNTDNRLQLYHNGHLVNSKSSKLERSSIDDVANLFFGAYSKNGFKLDDFAVWCAFLSDDDITTIYSLDL